MITTSIDPIQGRLQQIETLIRSNIERNTSGLAMAMCKLITTGGKRIRPRIALLIGSMLGADVDQLLHLAAAIEMLHTATLVHDDLVDGALLRRGLATLNAQWSPAASVLAGDFAFTRAAKLVNDTNSIPVIRMFTETIMLMVDGEVTQLSSKRGIASQEEYYRWISAKTASMFELASGAAALLSPVGEDVVMVARRFGYAVGMAFQIADDILDFTGNPFILGKPIGNDLRQGIITLPTLYYLETHPNDPDIRAIINKEGGDDHQPDRLFAAIFQNGAIEKAMLDAEGFVQRSLAALAALPDTPERQALAEIARSVVKRSN